ncbi:hypothetical protein NPIL_190101 [Nephila pilipes]|uniref:Uncharacterized protein n=1 Tax=Nephila pilipes TaxID=299642 RepID=A0A8X6R067_NEPPI|nr:hypothetical protein NPIL_190101 [Nephila pilipes]
MVSRSWWWATEPLSLITDSTQVESQGFRPTDPDVRRANSNDRFQKTVGEILQLTIVAEKGQMHVRHFVSMT